MKDERDFLENEDLRRIRSRRARQESSSAYANAPRWRDNPGVQQQAAPALYAKDQAEQEGRFWLPGGQCDRCGTDRCVSLILIDKPVKRLVCPWCAPLWAERREQGLAGEPAAPERDGPQRCGAADQNAALTRAIGQLYPESGRPSPFAIDELDSSGLLALAAWGLAYANFDLSLMQRQNAAASERESRWATALQSAGAARSALARIESCLPKDAFSSEYGPEIRKAGRELTTMLDAALDAAARFRGNGWAEQAGA